MGLARSKSAKSPALAAIISGTHELTSLDSEGRRSQALVQIEAGEILEITTLRIVVCYSLSSRVREVPLRPRPTVGEIWEGGVTVHVGTTGRSERELRGWGGPTLPL